MPKYTVEQAISKIQYLYECYGTETYEEKCTQLQHAQQCATLAIEWQLDEEIALAAFLHDIGHLIAQNDRVEGFTPYGHADHDRLGAKFLAECGFSKRLLLVILEHVQVKRYLVAAQPGYFDTLSEASVYTLNLQGGMMNKNEVKAYAKTPYIEEIIQLRKLDDSGKMPEMICFELSYWMELAKKHLLNNKTNVDPEIFESYNLY
jgi:putative nucleotidyltransferase with HDIG domain